MCLSGKILRGTLDDRGAGLYFISYRKNIIQSNDEKRRDPFLLRIPR